MNDNECILLTIKIKDDLKKTINTIRNKEFKKTGNPSFRIFNNSLILGLYNGEKLPQNIELPDNKITIKSSAYLVEGILYYGIENDFALLKDKINSKVDFTLLNKYFPLSTIINKELNPLIYLANNIEVNHSSYNLNESYILDDFKIELIKVHIGNCGITYSIVDYRHLQNYIV
jgi:hypothetical protein